jgi:hypothetical protein
VAVLGLSQRGHTDILQTLDTAQKANGETSTQELTSKLKKRKQINDFYAEEKRANHAARAAAQRGPGGVGRFMSMEGIAPDSSSYVAC